MLYTTVTIGFVIVFQLSICITLTNNIPNSNRTTLIIVLGISSIILNDIIHSPKLFINTLKFILHRNCDVPLLLIKGSLFLHMRDTGLDINERRLEPIGLNINPLQLVGQGSIAGLNLIQALTLSTGGWVGEFLAL